MYDFGALCSYDEVRISRASPAVEGNKRGTAAVMQDHTVGLVYVIADNFDCNISSSNGLKQTHSLVMLWAQLDSGNHVSRGDKRDETFPRVKKSSLKDSSLNDVSVFRYHGPKNRNATE